MRSERWFFATEIVIYHDEIFWVEVHVRWDNMGGRARIIPQGGEVQVTKMKNVRAVTVSDQNSGAATSFPFFDSFLYCFRSVRRLKRIWVGAGVRTITRRHWTT